MYVSNCQGCYSRIKSLIFARFSSHSFSSLFSLIGGSGEANDIDISKFEEPLMVEINSRGEIRVIQKDNFNQVVSENDLADTIISIYKNKKIDKVYVKGDKNIEYEKVIRLISILNKGGVENIGLITLPVNE